MCRGLRRNPRDLRREQCRYRVLNAKKLSEYLRCEEACDHLDSQDLKNREINNYSEQDYH